MSEAPSLDVLIERIDRIEKARELQAKEYERRLMDLNHAHEKQVQDQRTYVSAEKFEGFEAWRREVDGKLTSLEGRSSGSGSTLRTIGQVLTFVLSLLGIALALWRSTT